MQLDGKVAVHQLEPTSYSLVLLLFSLGAVSTIQQKNLMLSLTLDAATLLSGAWSNPLHAGETSGGGSATLAPSTTLNSPVC